MTQTMNRAKYLVAILAAAILAIALAVPAQAHAAVTQNPATGTITINPPEGATGTNTYQIYKVFDATVSEDGNHVAYKLLDGVADADTPTGFSATNGYVTEAPGSLNESADAIADYGKKQLVDTVTTTGTTAGISKSLEPGYYYITTTTGTAVVVDAGGNITINDKNSITTVKKSAGTEYDENSMKAIAAVGTSQSFTAVITKGKGAKNVVFTDIMTNMTYNGDVSFTVSGEQTEPTDTQAVVENTANGFTVTFDNDYIAGLADNTTITLNYSGKITSDALTVDPATNKAKVTSGEEGSSNVSESGVVGVYNATISVTKIDGSDAPLAGAKFKLQNKSTGKYYAGSTTDGNANWTDAGVEVEATGNDNDGYIAQFKGLKDGTYTLVESTVPAGYNKADDKEIVISGTDYTALAKAETVVNKTGIALPSTGGMGTTILYIVGGVLILGAGVVLVAKRRMANRRRDEDLI